MSHKNDKGIVLPFQKLLLTSFAVSVFVGGLFSVSISNAQELCPNKKSEVGYQLEQEIISLSSSLGVISDNGRNAVQAKPAEFSRSRNIILFAVFNKAEKGRVAGVESLNGSRDNYENNKGLIVVPLEGDMNSAENRELVKRIGSSFSDEDEVNIEPSEDGVSGTITSKEYPDDNFLYLMVPVKE